MMAVNITIRAVPDEVRAELAARAREEGRSLQEFLSRQLAEIAARPSLEEAVARARRDARRMAEVSTDDVIRDIDADRR